MLFNRSFSEIHVKDQDVYKRQVFGNSGGKDSALVGILCKAACDNTVGIIMPCSSARNFGSDAEDGRKLAEQYGIETRLIDLTPVREAERCIRDKHSAD